ncbi:unnamed protein product [Cyprideis torosa]|uniref:DDB1- and CUL4-associated factor 13 n=1 Tax=Cyprideis torosa TaxID=163714 RepID=A0A7R8W711_9CRUS|nr:unnamed protein product [Cyprideis torosa]CAG0887048.1 unnamed protein product [Cyprideis torosa]
MKVKVLCRNPDDYLRETKDDIFKVERNFDPVLHPFEVPREYTRALNAVKLERVFAKPFIGALDGHKDVVSCMSKNPKSLRQMASGAMDGEVILWDLGDQRQTRRFQAHSRAVRGVCFAPTGRLLFTIGDDANIHTWSCEPDTGDIPTNTIIAKGVLSSLSHHATDPLLATCGSVGVEVWEVSGAAQPIKTFTWSEEHPSYHCVKFNPSETNVVAAAASDRSILFCDLRQGKPMRRVVTKLKTNSLAWNPIEPFVFTSANEDYNLYSFDIRNLKMPLNIHKDHVSAVVDVDYCPTGQELVSAGYDKTIRIFPVEKLRGRQKAALEYNEKLKEKFSAHPQIKRISKHRHVPKHVYNAKKEIREIFTSQKRKEANRRLHSKPGTVPLVSEKAKPVLHEQQ